MRINEILYENQNTVFKNLYLCEGIYYSKNLLTEQMIYEGFLDSAKQYLGAQFNKKVSDIKGAIADVKSAAILIKDVVSDQDMLDSTVSQLGKQVRNMQKAITGLVNQIKTSAPALAPIIDKAWAGVQTFIGAFTQTTGWKGFLSKLGLYGFLGYLRDVLVNATSMSNTAMSAAADAIMNKLGEFSGLLANVTMPGFMAFFEGFATVKKYFLDILSYIKQKLSFTISKPAAPAASTPQPTTPQASPAAGAPAAVAPPATPQPQTINQNIR